MVVPPKHPKMITFSRKTHGFVGETHHFRKPPYYLVVIVTRPSFFVDLSVCVFLLTPMSAPKVVSIRGLIRTALGLDDN